jgi:uroporphyrinogen-III synthase
VKRLTGKRILLTRSAEDCLEWAEKLTQSGATAVALPCITTELIDTPELRTKLAAAVAETDWVVFTSRRGVEAFGTLYPGALGSVRVAVVGATTGEVARERLGRVDLVGRGGAARLATTMLAEGVLHGEPRMLLALAENAEDLLDRALQGPARCTRFDVYRTLPAPRLGAKRAISSLGADNVFFASPSAVTGFMNQVDLDVPVGIYTIGPSTSAAARAAGLAVTAEASQPSLMGLVELLL